MAPPPQQGSRERPGTSWLGGSGPEQPSVVLKSILPSLPVRPLPPGWAKQLNSSSDLLQDWKETFSSRPTLDNINLKNFQRSSKSTLDDINLLFTCRPKHLGPVLGTVIVGAAPSMLGANFSSPIWNLNLRAQSQH